MIFVASCHEWSLLVALVLRDAETIQRLITRSHDQALETMAAVLKAIGKLYLLIPDSHCSLLL